MMSRTGRNIYLWAALLLLWAVPSFAKAQVTVTLNMDVDKRQVEMGDTLTVTLEFKQLGTSNSAVIQEPSLPTSENFEIRGRFDTTQVSIINRQVAQIARTTYKLEATKLGSATLGPALLIYQDASGQRREIKSNIVTVTVVEKQGFSLFGRKKVEPTPTESQANAASTPTDDLKGIKGLPSDSFNWISFIFWLIVLLVIVGFVWRQYNKGAKPKAQAVPVGKAAELQQAWKKLGRDELSSKEFALELSNLVRECLQYRYSFQALDLTTAEILRELNKQKVKESEKDAVEKCLKTSDRVLYADGNLTNKDALRTACATLLPKTNK